jgi:hypothetical protein
MVTYEPPTWLRPAVTAEQPRPVTQLLVGGSSHDTYMEPTVLADLPLSGQIRWEEQFGPLLPVVANSREGLGYSIDECTELKTVVMPD